MKNQLSTSISVCLAILCLTACTATEQNIQDCVTGEPAGFLLGLWHGIIAPFTFIVSLFSDTITVYEVNNNGGWYLFGFLLGVGTFLGGSSKGAKKARKRS